MLGVLYESFIHPITILSTLPSAGVGALLALMLFHQDLSVVAIIGIILLIGIVKKNGIMIVDFALEAEREHGKDSTEAIYEASLLRFRPIMMTTMAALLGGIPLALGTGLGSELRRPLGIAMVGGLLLSQVLTLYTTPVIYIFFDRLGQRISGRRPSARAAAHAGDLHAQPEETPSMNFSWPFIHRPVATTLLTIAVAIAGAIAFTVLPVSPLPQVDFPTISVSAGLPGASAEIMAASVATPLERQFGHIAGVTEMTSSSSLGSTSITLQFDLSRNIDGAARDVQAAINAARTYLPANLPSNPSYRKVNPADAPIMILGLTSDKYDVTKVYDLASTVLEQKLSQIQGVGQVFVGGGATPSVRVEVDPTKLESFGLTLASVQSDPEPAEFPLAPRPALRRRRHRRHHHQRPDLEGRRLQPAHRRLPQRRRRPPLRRRRRRTTPRRTSAPPATWTAPAPSSSSSSASPAPTSSRPSTTSRPSCLFSTAVLPQGINITIVLDRTTTIRASVHDVESTLRRLHRSGGAGGLHLPAQPPRHAHPQRRRAGLPHRHLRRDVPVRLQPRQPLPDGAHHRHRLRRRRRHRGDGEHHPPPRKRHGALRRRAGRRAGDRLHRLLHQHVADRRLHSHPHDGRHRRPPLPRIRRHAFHRHRRLHGHLAHHHAHDVRAFAQASRRRTRSTTSSTAPARSSSTGCWPSTAARCRWVLDNPVLILIVLALTIALNVVVIVRIPKGFFPQQDTGAIVGGVQGPQDASFPFMNYSVQQLVKVIKADPGVAHVNAYTGGNGSSNGGFIYIALKPLGKGPGQRTESAMQIINGLRPKMNRLPVASAFLQPAQDLRIGGRGSNALYQYTIQSDNIPDLAHWGPILLEEMRKLPGLQDVNTDQQNGGLEEMLNYDRVTAARLGQTPQSLDSALYSAFGQSEVSVIYTQLNQYYVVLEVAPQYWQSPEGLKNIYLAHRLVRRAPASIPSARWPP